MAGYVMIRQGVNTNSSSKTGTILDKFSETQQSTVNSQQSTRITEPFLVADRKVLSFTNSLASGKILYVEKGTGKVFETTLENRTEELASSLIPVNLLSVIWSPNKKEIIASFSSAPGLKFKYYNLETGRMSDLDPDIRSLAFSPDGNYIAYHSVSPVEEIPFTESETEPEEESQSSNPKEPNKILVSQPDGSYSKKVLNTRLDELTLGWPTKEKIAFKTREGALFLLTEQNQLDKIIELNRTESGELWSKNGKKLLISQFDQTTLMSKLIVKDIESREEISLDFAAKASQCAWSIDNIHIFCVTPETELYKINISENSRELLALLNYPARNPLLSPAEDYFLFISSADEKLYSIKIDRGNVE